MMKTINKTICFGAAALLLLATACGASTSTSTSTTASRQRNYAMEVAEEADYEEAYATDDVYLSDFLELESDMSVEPHLARSSEPDGAKSGSGQTDTQPTEGGQDAGGDDGASGTGGTSGSGSGNNGSGASGDDSSGSGSDDGSDTTPAQNNRKLITTVSISAETDDLDAFNARIEQKTNALGGYLESANIYNGRSYYYDNEMQTSRSADYIIRVPAARLDEFLSDVQAVSNVLDRSRNVEDVTLTYVDISSRKKALVTERDRLTELVWEADSVEDIIALEERIATVRYEIESIESRLRVFDNQIDYSTIYLNVSEVLRYTPLEEASPITRMREGFLNSIFAVGRGIREFFIGLVINLPQIVVFVLIVLVCVVVIRRLLKRFGGDSEERQKRKAEKRKAKQAKKDAKKQKNES